MMKLNVKDQEIRLIKHQEEDYICLTEEAGLHAFTSQIGFQLNSNCIYRMSSNVSRPLSRPN